MAKSNRTSRRPAAVEARNTATEPAVDKHMRLELSYHAVCELDGLIPTARNQIDALGLSQTVVALTLLDRMRDIVRVLLDVADLSAADDADLPALAQKLLYARELFDEDEKTAGSAA